MKNTKYFLLYFAAVLVLGLTACKKKDDFTGASTLKATSPTASKSLQDSYTMIEKDTIIPFTITLSEPQIVDVKINISVADGATATEGSDFDFTHSITIPAYSTSGSGEVKIYSDVTVEGDETFTLVLGDNKTANVNFAPRNVVFTLQNFVASYINVTFDWNNTVDLDGTEVSLCDSVDMDIYFMDKDTVDTQIYSAASAACPEVFTTNPAWSADDYFFWSNLWENHVRPASGTIDFPITITVTRPGVSPVSFLQPTPSITTSDDADNVVDGQFVIKNVVQLKIKASGKYDFIDPYTGDVLLEDY